MNETMNEIFYRRDIDSFPVHRPLTEEQDAGLNEFLAAVKTPRFYWRQFAHRRDGSIVMSRASFCRRHPFGKWDFIQVGPSGKCRVLAGAPSSPRGFELTNHGLSVTYNMELARRREQIRRETGIGGRS